MDKNTLIALIIAIAVPLTTFFITVLIKTIGTIYRNILEFRNAHVSKKEYDEDIQLLKKEMREDMLMYKIEIQEQSMKYIDSVINSRTSDLGLLKEKAFNMEGLSTKLEAKYEMIENITDKVTNTETVVRSLERRVDQIQYGSGTTSIGRRKE